MFNLFKPHILKLPHLKKTANLQTVAFRHEKQVKLALIQARQTPAVKKGDTVCVGQVVGTPLDATAVYVHASVSGTVVAVSESDILIQSDGLFTPLEALATPVIGNFDDFIQAVRLSGLVGLGGAGFPAHIKWQAASKNTIDTLLINAAECEPYITSDVREIIENMQDIKDGIDILAKQLGVKKTIIGIESHNKTAIDLLKQTFKGASVEIKVLPTDYPQGAEKILIKSCTGKILPVGKLPFELGIIVSNVSTVGELGRYMNTGMPLVSRRVTVDGGSVKTAQNVSVPIGTTVADVIDFCGGYGLPVGKLLLGGPMMGVTVNEEDVISNKTNGLIVMSTVESIEKEELNCIRCARCIDNCPVDLLPVSIDQAVRVNDLATLKTLDLDVCLGCGMCSFVCPSNRTLVHHIGIGKELLKAEEKGGQK